jgi:hypothetical protein
MGGALSSWYMASTTLSWYWPLALLIQHWGVTLGELSPEMDYIVVLMFVSRSVMLGVVIVFMLQELRT